MDDPRLKALLGEASVLPAPTGDRKRPRIHEQRHLGSRRREPAEEEWIAVREWFCADPDRTLWKATERLPDAKLSDVKRRAEAEDWEGKRARVQRALTERATNEALDRAFEDKIRALQVLLEVEYRESLVHLTQLQQLRKEKGASWKPSEHRACAATKGMLFDRARLALGAPTEIGATPGEAAASGAVLKRADPDLLDLLDRLPLEDLLELDRIAAAVEEAGEGGGAE